MSTRHVPGGPPRPSGCVLEKEERRPFWKSSYERFSTNWANNRQTPAGRKDGETYLIENVPSHRPPRCTARGRAGGVSGNIPGSSGWSCCCPCLQGVRMGEDTCLLGSNVQNCHQISDGVSRETRPHVIMFSWAGGPCQTLLGTHTRPRAPPGSPSAHLGPLTS